MTIKKIREESVESHETSIVQLAAFVEGMGLQSFGGLIDANSVGAWKNIINSTLKNSF